MEPGQVLKTFLQHQLASDANAVRFLPSILPTLSAACFSPSPHLQKWSARLSSLIHSKDPGARWAGFCLALQTAKCSKALMIEGAQGWIGAALPLLSKNELVPNIKAAIRLLAHIFSAATDILEFQRQLATPNVPKYSLALLALADKHRDHELQMLAINSLTQIIPLFPTLHRGLHASLSSFVLRRLNGSTPEPTDASILEASSRLYAVLPVTGGKVGAATLWRKSVDETVLFLWNAFATIRTTFPSDARLRQQHSVPDADPLLSIPLNLDRLRCGIIALCDLLRFTSTRPVQMPIGAIAQLCFAFLSCTNEEKTDGHVDLTTRALEESATADILSFGCMLLRDLVACARQRLTSHVPRFISVISFHLEHITLPQQRLPFLSLLTTLLEFAQPLHNVILPTRTVKALLSILSVLLPSQSDVSEATVASGTKGKKGKKRTRGYEGDEVFKISSSIIFPTIVEGICVLKALDALRLVLHNPYLAPATYSTASRFLLSINLSLPLIASHQISQDLTLHLRILSNVQAMCLEVGAGTSSVLSKSLGLVLNSGSVGHDLFNHASAASQKLDLFLHPRAPPLVRSLPHVESLSLFRTEESNEEIDVRTGLGIGVAEQTITHSAIAQDAHVISAPHVAAQGRDNETRGWQTSGQSRSMDFTSTTQPAYSMLQIETPSTTPAAKAVPSKTLPTQLTSSSGSDFSSQVPDAMSRSTLTETRSNQKPRATTARPVTLPVTVLEDDEDEEMPSIDMESDSD